jgi:hypothetical protein
MAIEDQQWGGTIQEPFLWLSAVRLRLSEYRGDSTIEVDDCGVSTIEVDDCGDVQLLKSIPGRIADLMSEVDSAVRGVSEGGEACFVCLAGQKRKGAFEFDAFLVVAEDPYVLVRLAANKLEGWKDALWKYAPPEVRAVLRKTTVRLFGEGKLREFLIALIDEADLSNKVILDKEAWCTRRSLIPFSSEVGTIVVDNEELKVREEFVVREVDVGENASLLSFRFVRLSFLPNQPLLLVYSVNCCKYESEEFVEWAEKLLCRRRLLLTDHIVQRLCSFHKALFGRIVGYIEDRQVESTCALGRKHIIDSLRNYTCEVTGRQATKFKAPDFLRQLEPNEGLSLNVLESLFHVTLEEKDRIDHLAKLEGKHIDFHTFVLDLIKRRRIETSAVELEMLATFNFSLNGEIASATLKSLPVARGITYPAVGVMEILPVLLRKTFLHDQDNGRSVNAAVKLHRDFSRHVVLFANVEAVEFPFLEIDQGSVQFGLASWDHNLTETEAREAMSLLAHRRLPLHERRVLQLLQIPCRESLDDMEALSLGRVTKEKGTPDKPLILTAESCDEALLKSIDSVRNLRRELKGARSQKDVEAVLRKLTFGEGGDFPSDSAIPTIEVLARIAEFSHVESSELLEWMQTRRDAFNRGGNYLLDLLIECVQSPDQEGFSKSGKDVLGSKLRMKLWNEFQIIFPDNSDWTGFKKVEESASRGVSLFAQTVLNSVFQRPYLINYEKPPVLPKRELQLALQSVQRVHRLAAVFPACCGDWSTNDYFREFHKMRKYAESRIFASIKPDWRRQQNNGETIMADECLLAESCQCFGSQCLHAPNHKSSLRLLLWKIAEKTGQMESFVRTVERCGFWINTIIDAGAHHHFRCKCGELFVPEPTKAEAYYFSCPKWSPESNGLHDKDIYINWCLGCGAVIDSRECRKCSRGKYVCKNCDGCCRDHSKNASRDGGPACFECRRELPVPSLVKFANGHPFQVDCVCGVKNQVYPSSFSRNSNFANAALWPREIGWRYNTRDIIEDGDRDGNRIEADYK